MRKTPSYLKGLAETRGRLAGDVQRYQQVLAEVTASLVKAQAEMAACDTLIRKFDDRLDPGLVQPIHAWQGRYGKRGALREAIIELLLEQAQATVSTTEIGWQMQLKFGITFCHPKEREQWINNSIGNCLKKLAGKEGLAEACHDRSNTGEVGRWRWVGGPGTP